MKSPKEKYQRRKDYYKKILEKQEKRINLISNLRLITVIAAIVSLIFLYKTPNNYIPWGTAGFFALIFLIGVVYHNKIIKSKRYISALYKTNDISMKRLEDEWKKFEDTGAEFKDEDHPFSQDLDIFGAASLFQWINTANTNIGRKKLKEILTEQCSNISEIRKRQEAVTELSQKRWWRQKLAVEGMMISGKTSGDEDLFIWADERNVRYKNRSFVLMARFMPVITISVLISAHILGLIPGFVFNILAIVQFGMLVLGGKKRNKILETVYRQKNTIKLNAKVIRLIEETSFKSSYLIELKKKLVNRDNDNASKQIKSLERIVDSIANRNNALFFPINILLLWDYQSMIALERWKEKSGEYIRTWIETIGMMEALSSLAVIKHDYRNWTMPEITEKRSVFRAEDMGHPLLTNRQVSNDLMIEQPTKTLLITGSNMSGKSTFLRTAAINLVLAYAGAPVCASSFRCSVMRVYTCMRISDNLEKSISSFYAELLRIRDIIHASKGKEQIFYLLDEIFKGTNSQDRHTGAKLVIKNLNHHGAVGLVSTHDLELGELEKESEGRVKNYHFQEHYKDNLIYFDYKLRPGVSTTRNALYLMKMVGIDGED